MPSSSLSRGVLSSTVGISSTPVIHRAIETRFVVADRGTDLTPITGSSPMTSSTAMSCGEHFDPLGSLREDQLQRAALALDAGNVIIIGYEATTAIAGRRAPGV